MGRYSGSAWGGGGVSRGLNCTYLKGIVVMGDEEDEEGRGKDEGKGENGNDVLVECEVVGKVGGRNVVLRGLWFFCFFLFEGGWRGGRRV